VVHLSVSILENKKGRALLTLPLPSSNYIEI